MGKKHEIKPAPAGTTVSVENPYPGDNVIQQNQAGQTPQDDTGTPNSPEKPGISPDDEAAMDAASKSAGEYLGKVMTDSMIDSVLGNAQQADGLNGPLAVPAGKAQEAPKRTLEQACSEFIGVLDGMSYRGGRRHKVPGDLMALRAELENFMKIGHGILKEPVE